MTDDWKRGNEKVSCSSLIISRLIVNSFSKIDRATFAAIVCPSSSA